MRGTPLQAMYDSCQPLTSCDFPGPHKRIGVIASKPFHHCGANATYVDVHYDTVRVGSVGYGMSYPVERAAEEIERATRAAIANLDKVIADLAGHRDRLRQELGNVRAIVGEAVTAG